jgi:hypothetical protein
LKEEPNANFRILRNSEGKVNALELKQNGATMRLPRVQ